MTVEKTTDEVLKERERGAFEKPRPYTPDHPNLLEEGLVTQRIAKVPMFSGPAKLSLIFLAILATLYGMYGLMIDDLYLPAKRSAGTHYHGVGALLIFGMIASFAGCLITWAVSEYDPELRRMTNKRLLTGLCISLIVFMMAGITANVIDL